MDKNSQEEKMIKTQSQFGAMSAGGAEKLGTNPLLMNKTGLSVNLDDDDNKSEESEIKEELNPEEDFRLCGKQIQDTLYAGEEISD